MNTHAPIDANPKRAVQAREEVAPVDARAVNTKLERNAETGATTLYRARLQIYPKRQSGIWRQLKWAAMAVLLAIYYVTPWLRWDRGPGRPDQAVLVDVANGRFFFFGIEIWPQEIYYVTGLLILASLGLFLATALFGRLWCGYACPQTVWTDLFIAVEEIFQGDRAARIRLDKSPMSFNKAWRKTATHSVWLLIAVATGGAWVFYFHDAPSLAAGFFQGTAPASAYVFMGILTFTTYALAGLMREQVCTYMCPWPRIQAAMTDSETLSVSYKRDRGEPRAPVKKGASFEGRGHCIDCKQCVAACPMGIDIRDGLQLECINCGLCIDACNAVMDKVGLPRGLIGYDSEILFEKRLAGQKARPRLIRARTIVYSFVMAAVAGVMLLVFAGRSTMELNVLRDRNPNYVRLSDGTVRNGYTLKIVNRAGAARPLVVTMDAPAGIAVQNDSQSLSIEAPADKVATARIFLITRPEAATAGSTSISFILTDPATGERVDAASVFVAR